MNGTTVIVGGEYKCAIYLRRAKTIKTIATIVAPTTNKLATENPINSFESSGDEEFVKRNA